MFLLQVGHTWGLICRVTAGASGPAFLGTAMIGLGSGGDMTWTLPAGIGAAKAETPLVAGRRSNLVVSITRFPRMVGASHKGVSLPQQLTSSARVDLAAGEIAPVERIPIGRVERSIGRIGLFKEPLLENHLLVCGFHAGSRSTGQCLHSR